MAYGGSKDYILGGLGRVEGPSAAEAMDLAQREEQRFRDAQRAARQTELGMQETRQRMALAQSAEQRAQQTFQAQQAARAQAAARAAQARATEQQRLEMFRDIFGGPATPTGGVSGVTPIAPVAPPRAGLALPTGSSVPLSFGTAVPGAAPAAPAPATPAAGTPLSMGPVAPAGGVQVASIDPMESFLLAFESRPDLFGGGIQVADASGAIPAGGPGTFPPGILPAAEQPLFPQAPDQFVLTQIDVPNFVPGVGMINYVQYNPATGEIRGPNGQPIDPIIQEQMRESASFNYADSIENTAAVAQSRLERARAATDQAAASGDQAAYARALDEFRAAQVAAEAAQAALPNATAALRTTQPITSRGIFSEEGPGAAGLPAPVNEQVTAPSPEVAETGTLEVPISPGTAGAAGLSFPFTPSVELSFSIGEETPSERYLNNADLVMMDRDRVAQQIARTQQLLQYYATTGDRTGLDQGLAMVQAQDELAKLEINQRYLDGMVALSAIQNGNFGPLQYLLQQRPENQGRTVEVRPYTDGTVEIYVDGQLDVDLPWTDLVSDLQYVYDRGYRELREAQAQEIAERNRYRFEQLTQAERDILVEQAKNELEVSGAGGTLESVTDAEGTPILQYTINGRRIPVSAERYVVQVPGVGNVTRIKLRRVDTGEIIPLDVE